MDLQRAGERIGRVVVDRRHRAGDAGVAEDDVEPPERSSLRDGAGHGVLVSDVCHSGQHVPRRAPWRRLQLVGIDSDEVQLRALVDQQPADASPIPDSPPVITRPCHPTSPSSDPLASLSKAQRGAFWRRAGHGRGTAGWCLRRGGGVSWLSVVGQVRGVRGAPVFSSTRRARSLLAGGCRRRVARRGASCRRSRGRSRPDHRADLGPPGHETHLSHVPLCRRGWGVDEGLYELLHPRVSSGGCVRCRPAPPVRRDR